MNTADVAAPDGNRKVLRFKTRNCGMAEVVTRTYSHGGGLAVELVDEDGELIATLSVNMREYFDLLGENEFFAKTWSENEEIAAEALASGIFEDTGKAGGFLTPRPGVSENSPGRKFEKGPAMMRGFFRAGLMRRGRPRPPSPPAGVPPQGVLKKLID